MKVAWNKVLIRPDKDYDKVKGFNVAGGEQLHWSIYGTVEVVPDRLFCFCKKARSTMKWKDPLSLEVSRFISSVSLPNDTKMELKVGDRVIFSYTSKFDLDQFKKVGDLLVVDYDMIYGVVEDDKIKAINGYLLVSVMEKDEKEEILPYLYVSNDDINKYGLGEVKYSGVPNTGYLHYDEVDPQVSGIVAFNGGLAARLEKDYHNSLNHNKSSLFKLRAKDVLLWTNTIN